MNFIIFGLGYISKKHLQAIKDVKGTLIAAYDPASNVGHLDSYFPDCKYFNKFELIDNYLDDKRIDYMVICTPNYLHYSHIKYGLSKGYKIICEKPLVIDYEHYKKIKNNKNIYPIFQLRLKMNKKNKDILLKYKQNKEATYKDMNIDYYVYRGNWYDETWKGEYKKSGGIVYNLGIHIIDFIVSVLGRPIESKIIRMKDKYIELQLLYNGLKIHINLCHGEKKNIREIKYYNDTINLSNGFTKLHSNVYKRIINEKWITIKDIDNTMKVLRDLYYV